VALPVVAVRLMAAGAATDVAPLWAMYRASLGVAPAIAFEDGVTAGLGASGPAVQARLGDIASKAGSRP
jgi:hypothetical protein